MVRLVKKIPFGSFTGQSRFDDLVATLRSVVAAQALDQRAQAEARMLLGRVLLVMEERQGRPDPKWSARSPAWCTTRWRPPGR